jgi:hypothetical protein
MAANEEVLAKRVEQGEQDLELKAAQFEKERQHLQVLASLPVGMQVAHAWSGMCMVQVM